MINNDRIVPVTQTDLLSLYGLILKQDSANAAMTVLQAGTVDGDFTVDSTGIKIANQPVKSVNFTAESGTLYFVAGYDYEGFKVNGVAVTVAAEISADAKTLYKAVLASGAVTVTQVGF